MVDYYDQDKKFMNNLRIGDIFRSYNNYSYIYYLGIDNDRRNNKKGCGEYMFNSVSIDCGDSIIYHYTKQGACIGLCNYEKISRNILNREIRFNMIKNILLKETKLIEDVIFYIKDFL
jgi:hypothetical protein